jgi:hypothetical protein
MRQKLMAVTNHSARFKTESTNIRVDFPLFQRLALPITCDRTKIAGIRIPATRMTRSVEVLLHGRSHRPTRSTKTPIAPGKTGPTAYSTSKANGTAIVHQQGNESGGDVHSFSQAGALPTGQHGFSSPGRENFEPPAKIKAAYHKPRGAIQYVLDLIAA